MPEVHPLEPISLREAWPDEARDFTPWLAGNLHLLAAELKLDLELEQVEATLPGAGRVDILARRAVTGDRVVIENQLEESDDSHCLRLLGYAANAEANTLVWVARDFMDYHHGILNWLNESDSIDVYAVTVRAYHVGGVLGASFRIKSNRGEHNEEQPLPRARPSAPITPTSTAPRWHSCGVQEYKQ